MCRLSIERMTDRLKRHQNDAHAARLELHDLLYAMGRTEEANQ